MSTSTTTPVIGYDLGSPSSPRAVSAWTTTLDAQEVHHGDGHVGYPDRHSSSSPTILTNTVDRSQYRPSLSSSSSSSHPKVQQTCYAVAFGTERGSLHYRIYPCMPNNNVGNDVPVFDHHHGALSSGSRIISSSFTGELVFPVSSCSIDYNSVKQVNSTSTSSSGPVVSMVRCVNTSTTATIPKNNNTQLFLVLIDDHKGSGPQQSQITSGAYSSAIVTIKHGTFQKVATGITMPRMSCAAYSTTTGFVYAAGTSVLSLPPSVHVAIVNALSSSPPAPAYHTTVRYQAANVLPNPVRSNPSALFLICNGHVAIVAVNNSFYAVPSVPQPQHNKSPNAVPSSSSTPSSTTTATCIKVVSLTQSSQVHPAIVAPISGTHASSLIFVASGRECTTCTVSLLDGLVHVAPGTSTSNNNMNTTITTNASINNHEITSLTSPILSAVSVSCANQTYVAILTTDGLVQLRLPVCIAVPLRTVEVGTRPNNFYWLGTFSSTANEEDPHQQQQPCLISVGYSGDARVIVIKKDTPLDLSDRLMRLSIDAFGSNGFPRSDLADALHASYSATSYIGPEPCPKAKQLLRQYLEAMLGFPTATTTTSYKPLLAAAAVTSSEQQQQEYYPQPRSITNDQHHHQQQQQQQHMDLILCSILCLVSTTLTPPSAILANRGAKAANTITSSSSPTSIMIIPKSIKKIAQTVSEALLQQASSYSNAQSSISLIRQSSAPITSSTNKNQGAESAMGFVEAALWLLRAAGLHERALHALQDQMTTSSSSSSPSSNTGWSLNKYETYSVSHLAELWSCRNLELGNLVLTTPVTKHLLESNPELGLSVFTSNHPASQQEWMDMEMGKSRVVEKDPVYHVVDIHPVVSLLKDSKVAVSTPTMKDDVADELVLLEAAEISADDSDDSEGGGLEVQYKGNGAVTVGGDYSPTTTKTKKEDLATSRPLYSGRDLAICFLESAIGISTGRPLTGIDNGSSELPIDTQIQDRTVAIHEELAYFLLEGVLCERGGRSSDSIIHKKDQQRSSSNNSSSSINRFGNADDDDDDCTTLGKIYRAKLRRLLAWPLFQGRAEQILASLPSSFLREKATLMGKLNRHEDALTILYRELQSLDLALEYCDARYAQLMRQKAAWKRRGIYSKSANSSTGNAMGECVYLPLVRVALESSSSITTATSTSLSPAPQQSGEEHPSDLINKRGVNAAIQVLSLRSHVIDRAAALRLLPSSIPVSAVARPFLIPALIESESQVRRYKVAASLLRARYVELKRALTEAQMVSQATLRSVIKLKNLDLGRKEPLRSSKPLLARPASSTTAPYFPHIMLTKHYFPRFLVIQAQITNDTPDRRTLGDVAFIVAESSSEDAIVPTVTVPLKALPARTTGSAWCVLEVSPSRLEETALLTCELRFTILAVDVATGVPLSFGEGGGRTYVEELADLEVASEEFLGKAVSFIPPTLPSTLGIRERI